MGWNSDDMSDLPWTFLIERFSHLTTEAAKRGDTALASMYLRFMEEEAINGSESIFNAVDTYYAELLLWDVKDPKTKQHIWKLIPPTLKSMYVKMWGEPNLK